MVGAHRPAEQVPGGQVQHAGQVQPAVGGGIEPARRRAAVWCVAVSSLEGLLPSSAHVSINSGQLQLEAVLLAWIHAWNQDPKPFVSTKPATRSLTASADTFNELQ